MPRSRRFNVRRLKIYRLWNLLTLALLAMIKVAHAGDFTYTMNNPGTITITGYTGTGGVVMIPEVIDSWTVTGVGSNAFRQLPSVTAITIPNSVTNIGDWAFGLCSNMTSLVLGNSVSVIGYAAFYFCSITNLLIPESVTRIGTGAFNHCTNLTSILIPQSVTSIGGSAFFFCSLTNVSIPNNITSISSHMFGSNTSLPKITIPSGVTDVGAYAFYSCTNLKSVYFKGNAPVVDSTTFLNASNVTVYYLPDTTGWGTTFGGRPTVLWRPQMSDGNGVGVQSNQFGFNINWSSGMTVIVEASTNLMSTNWIPIQTNTLTSDTTYFSDLQWTNHPDRFYRGRMP